MSQSEVRQVFVHVHIPKCGGSTFQAIMSRNFGAGFYRDSSLLEDYQYTAQQFEKIIKAHPWLQAYSAHKVSLDLPFSQAWATIYAIALVRDPVERFVSHYFFHRRIPEDYVPAAKHLSLPAYVDHALVQGHQQMYINGQTRFLTGRGDGTALETIQALLNQGRLFLLPLGRFDEACLVLEQRFPRQFRDCAYVRRNISRRDQNLSAANRETISAYARHDLELLELANHTLDQTLAELYPDADERNRALKQFHRRCARRKQIERVRQAILRPIIRLGRRFR